MCKLPPEVSVCEMTGLGQKGSEGSWMERDQKAEVFTADKPRE